MNPIKTLALAAVLATGACGTTEPISCTEEARAGIAVTVTDAVTGNALGQGTSLTVRDGTFVQTATDAFGNTLAAAWERAGTYEVAVARSGYHTWVRTGVLVSADECHVTTVRINVALQPIS